MVNAEIKYQNYRAGQQIRYWVASFSPNSGVIGHNYEESVVSKVSSGGFYGQYLHLEGKDYGIKITYPTPMHRILRHLAWGFKDFPPQVFEAAAREDHLAINLISDILPVVSNGKFSSPKSFGYTILPTGFSQLIEESHARPPRFNPVNEFYKFRKAQRQLTALAFDLGLEQVGQIHSDNPFAMANLWYDDATDQFVWLDTLAAFKHEPLFRLLRYKFHREIREEFCNDPSKQVTYNRIHTDIFRNYIASFEDKFDPAVYKRVMRNLNLYDELLAAKESLEQVKRTFKPVLISGGEVVKEMPGKVWDKLKGVWDLGAAVFHPGIRRRLVFEGLEEARERGLVTAQEYEQSKQLYKLHEEQNEGSTRFTRAEYAMGLYYFLSGVGTKFIEGGFHALNIFSDNDLFMKGLLTGGIYVGGQAISSASRFVGTNLIGLGLQVDLRAAARVAAIPGFGNLLPFPVQTLINTGSRSSALLHYAIRHKVASLSAILPSGGLGSEMEARWYLKGGPRIESLAVQEKVPQPKKVSEAVSALETSE